jgi:integrase
MSATESKRAKKVGKRPPSEEPSKVQTAYDLARRISDRERCIDPLVRRNKNTRAMTVAGLRDSFLDSGGAKRLAPRTLELRRQQIDDHVVPILGSRTKATSVSTQHIRLMIEALCDRGMAGSTVRSCVSSASALFAHGVRDLGILDQNPVRALERGELPSGRRQSEPRYLTIEELKLLFGAMTDRYRPVAATCFWAALRVSEALDLRWMDIDFDRGRLSVRGSKTRASNAGVPLLAELSAELRAHRTRCAYPSADALVFQTRTGRSPGRRNVHRAVSRAAMKVGLSREGEEPVGVHDLRHSFAAFTIAGGLTLAETARLLRHANPGVTSAIYAGLTDEGVSTLGAKLAAISR